VGIVQASSPLTSWYCAGDLLPHSLLHVPCTGNTFPRLPTSFRYGRLVEFCEVVLSGTAFEQC
jgi:hypothetical protein